MSTVSVRIPTPLRSFTGGADELQVKGATVGEVMAAIGKSHQGFLERVIAANGEIRNFVNLYIGSKNVNTLQGLSTPVSDGDVISIVPAVAGGSNFILGQ